MPRLRKRPDKSASSEPFWKIGLYIRLSREDDNENDSESVINQEKILLDFVEEHFVPGTYIIVDVFKDDGLTGTDKMRPQFRRLEKCIVRKEINCMIIKSLSRGFRNLGDQQKFLEEFIPIHGVRFINISSPFIDTYQNPCSTGGLEVPIRGMLNEQYAAITSDEIRKSFGVKRKRGEFIGAFAPYGFIKDPEDKSRLLVDQEAADVVRSIFHWFVYDGYSKRGIAQRLNKMGVLNPTGYKRKKGHKYQNPNSETSDGLWSASTIGSILQNEVYIGSMVQGRYRILSYKVHRQIAVPEDEWFVVKDTHQAIIDSATFEKAQALHRRDTRTSPGTGAVHMFAGLIFCPDCKKAMHRKASRNISYFHCRTFTDKKTCSKHTIRQDVLEDAVIHALQAQMMMADTLMEEVKRIGDMPAKSSDSKRLLNSLKTTQKRLAQHHEAADSLYLDWKTGDITKEEYHRLKSKLAAQIHQLEQSAAYIKEEFQVIAAETGSCNPFFTRLLEHQNIQELNRGMLVELVDKIWIHEKGEIMIDFSFSDDYKRFLNNT